ASNIGYYESNYFGVLPEANVNASYRITERLALRVGYSFLMDINVWRAGNQITTTIPPVIAPPTRSTLFLHGFNAGVSFNYYPAADSRRSPTPWPQARGWSRFCGSLMAIYSAVSPLNDASSNSR